MVLVPNYIPKSVRSYFSSAIVAFQSGQVLVALFLLRVLIEQFTREDGGAGSGVWADNALQAYTERLPADFKSRFPSLREVYASISVAMHSADASAELFESSLVRIEKHFDARRLFDL